MNDISRPKWLNLERHKKGEALVLVRCQRHFNERSDHAVRLRLIDLFSELRTTLLPTGARFQFDRLLPEERAIMATVPVAELKLFRAFLRGRRMDMSVVKMLPAKTRTPKTASSVHGSGLSSSVVTADALRSNRV